MKVGSNSKHAVAHIQFVFFSFQIYSKFRDLLVPISLFLILLIYSAIFSPRLFTSGGLASALIVTTPLILLTLSITPIAIVGRGGVDLAVGPLMGFINVTLDQYLFGYGIESPIIIFAFLK